MGQGKAGDGEAERRSALAGVTEAASTPDTLLRDVRFLRLPFFSGKLRSSPLA